MIILKDLCIIILLVSILAIVAKILLFILEEKNKNIMSFKDYFNTTGIPVVSFNNNGKEFNFILDTGATDSVINEHILSELIYDNTNIEGTIYGADGNIVSTPFISMKIEKNGKTYEDNFRVLDLSQAFSNFEQDYKITVHGLLSSTFFSKYGYNLDFVNLTACPRL